MKVALVCDDLIQHGGHEKVILDICRLFPDAPLYTTMASKEWREKCKQEGVELKTSFMQKLPFKNKLNRFYAPFLFYIVALENFDFTKYDLVISMSSRFAHGVITKPQTKHVCYMSTVGRMFWEPESYFEHENFGGLRILAKLFLSFPLLHLRIWDRVASTRPDHFITNSKTSQSRIKKYYGRDSDIIHPAIEVAQFNKDSEVEDSKDIEPYFFVLTRLASWKKVNIAVQACINQGLKLKVAGSGPDRDRLEKITRNLKGEGLVEFLGYTPDEDKIKHLKKCQALIITQFEDFGITPLESMACGTPVIALRKGGVLETIQENKTGVFFNEQTSESLESVLKRFSKSDYSKDEIINRAKEFDISVFNQELKSRINGLI